MLRGIRHSPRDAHPIFRRAQPLAACARLLVPHAVIGATAALWIARALDRPECVGFCALYAGSVIYAVLLVAVVLSSLVAAGQLILFRG